MKLTRYPKEEVVVSSLNHFEDVIDWLGYLTANEFVVSLLCSAHGCAVDDAKRRAAKIIPHAKYAVAYLEQVRTSPSAVSFLPAYYAILNLAKICILAGQYHFELTHHNRWHDAAYNVQAKDSHGLLTEQITLHEGGALALFYKTLTRIALTGRKKIRIGDLYPCILNVGAESSLAAGAPSAILPISFNPIREAGKLTVAAQVEGALPSNFSIRHVPALRGFRQDSVNTQLFRKYVGMCPNNEVQERMRSVIDTQYLFLSQHDISLAYHGRSTFKFTEEFPLALAFFHLSSVCRYKPEFLDRLIRSKYWPMLLAMRRHGLFKFIVLVWSFLNQKDFHIVRS